MYSDTLRCSNTPLWKNTTNSVWKNQQKYGWIEDATIYVHAKFEDKQNLVQGETKRRKFVCNLVGCTVHLDPQPASIHTPISLFYFSVHKILFILKLYMNIDCHIHYSSIFFAEFFRTISCVFYGVREHLKKYWLWVHVSTFNTDPLFSLSLYSFLELCLVSLLAAVSTFKN